MFRTVDRERLTPGLDTNEGLTLDQAAIRARHYGPNRIIETPATSRWLPLLDALRDPMLWFLGATAILFAAIGEAVDAAVLSFALLPLVGMDLYLHRRTQASTRSLGSCLAATAMASRDKLFQHVDADTLVPGDLVRVSNGEAFPADGVVIGGSGLQADESALTGEAFPVGKQAAGRTAPLPPSVTLPAVNWVFAGTRLLTGEALVRIAFTGRETVYGDIAAAALEGRHARTPMQHEIARLVTRLLSAAAVACLVLAGVRIAQGHGLFDAVLSAMTLAVAALPEEFPVVFTFFLGVGVYRLARQRALVRRAVVVENIGRTTCICTDKTGTLTEGQLRVAQVVPATEAGEQVLALAMACAPEDSSDPVDVALEQALRDSASTRPPQRHRFPFTEARRRETVIVEAANGLQAVTKGAPEIVLGMCPMSADLRAHHRNTVTRLSAQGLKVLAVALQPIQETHLEPASGFRLAGLIAFHDPLRVSAAGAVAACHAMGIRVLMLTGDHALTATAIARAAGLGNGNPRVCTAEELASGGRSLLDRIDAVARATPRDKLELVRQLQARGEIVAVTGDGVNDVPALQAADIGIAMGGRGTRSAREVSAIVLLDDDFSTLVQAIREGRQLFDNLRLSFSYLLMVHIPFVLTAALIPLAGFPLLYLPIHVVWLELLIHPSALLVFQELPGERSTSPRREGPFFSRRQWLGTVLTGLAITLVISEFYREALGVGYAVEHARALALLSLTLVSTGLVAGLSGPRTRAGMAIAVIAPVLGIAVIQTPALASRLALSALHDTDLALAVGAGVAAAIAGRLMRRTAT